MSFWDAETVLAELDKGAEKIFVKRVRKGTRTYIDIRTFWLDDADEWRPSRKGIAVPIELGEALVKAIQDGLTVD